jgi:hypothetical protein
MGKIISKPPVPAEIPPNGYYWIRFCSKLSLKTDDWEIEDWIIAKILEGEYPIEVIGSDEIFKWVTRHRVVYEVGPKIELPVE